MTPHVQTAPFLDTVRSPVVARCWAVLADVVDCAGRQPDAETARRALISLNSALSECSAAERSDVSRFIRWLEALTAA